MGPREPFDCVTHVIKQSNKGIKNMILSVFPAIDEVPATTIKKKFVDKCMG